MEDSSKPMFALLIPRDEKLRQDIVSGKVTAIIVKDYRGYVPDHELMLCCNLELWSVLVDVVEVSCMRFYGISQRNIQPAGYNTREEMMRRLKELDSSVDEPSSPFTIIRWENVRGRLVDDFRRKEELEHSEDYCT